MTTDPTINLLPLIRSHRRQFCRLLRDTVERILRCEPGTELPYHESTEERHVPLENTYLKLRRKTEN